MDSETESCIAICILLGTMVTIRIISHENHLTLPMVTSTRLCRRRKRHVFDFVDEDSPGFIRSRLFQFCEDPGSFTRILFHCRLISRFASYHSSSNRRSSSALQLSMADNENLQTLHTTTVQYKRRRNCLTTTNVNSSSSTPLALLHFSQNYSATFRFSGLPKGLKAESGLCPDFQPFPWKPQPKKALFLAERRNRAWCDSGLRTRTIHTNQDRHTQ